MSPDAPDATHNTSVESSPAPAAPPVTDTLVRAVADETGRDERSVTRRLAGLPVKGRAGVMIDRALAARGLKRGA